MRVVVTGATGDIGAHICSILNDAGHVALGAGSDQCDVTSTDSVRSLLGASWPFQAVVNCHGAPGRIKPTLTLTDEEWGEVVDVDLTGTFRVCREAARFLTAALGGAIVNVSSIHALATYPERAVYAAAKAGVVGLTRALAIEWGKYGLRVNAVLPGQVMNTDRTDAVMSARLLERSPTGRLATAEDVAQAVLSLLKNKGINGTTLVVDHGWLASAYWGPHG